jgi:hypothetical protein
MYTQTSDPRLAESARGEVLIPLIRAAATIGFAIAPCSLGFAIIAASEHLIRSIMVGDDPEMLISDLQNQFPNDVIEIIENDDAGLVAQGVDSIERPDRALTSRRSPSFAKTQATGDCDAPRRKFDHLARPQQRSASGQPPPPDVF